MEMLPTSAQYELTNCFEVPYVCGRLINIFIVGFNLLRTDLNISLEQVLIVVSFPIHFFSL